MPSIQTTHKVADDLTIHATWQGGPYIEMGLGFGRAVEVINVYDYAKGENEIPFTKKAMRAKINEWVFEYPKADLIHDMQENWIYY